MSSHVMGGRAVICAACQSANEDDALFCEHCGQPLEQCCPACGTPAKAQARFCRKCGQSLRQAADPGQPVSSLPPAAHAAALDDTRDRLQRDVPSHLTEKILASRGRLEGERKQVTVLFADLKDSTELINPTATLLRTYFSSMKVYGHVKNRLPLLLASATPRVSMWTCGQRP